MTDTYSPANMYQNENEIRKAKSVDGTAARWRFLQPSSHPHPQSTLRQLGLKLKSEKEQIEVTVVDSVEKPSEN